MEHRRFGHSGLKVPVLSFGTATFGGSNTFFKAFGATQDDEAKRIVDVCLDAGLYFFDTANMYSQGTAEEILGRALEGRRARTLISTKATFRMGEGHNDLGSSRLHLMRAVEDSLKRLKTDYIDLYHMHGFDALTPVEETLRALDDIVKSGKVRYIACSNFSGWHLMKSLAVSQREGLSRYVGHQVYYSLAGREYEWELMQLGQDQGVGAMIWSPLAGGALSGKIRRGKTPPKDSRVGQIDFIPFDTERVYGITEALDVVAKETGKTIVQVALNWVLQRPTVTNIVVGARNLEQLEQNLGAVGWNLTKEQVAILDKASAAPPAYPYWHQRGQPELGLSDPTHPTSAV